jgi:hypothetical protein
VQTARAVTFSSHLFSPTALVKRSRIQVHPNLFNLPIAIEFYNPAINHIVLPACQSLNADQLLLSYSQKYRLKQRKTKHAAQNSLPPKTQVIRKKGMNADKTHSPFL